MLKQKVLTDDLSSFLGVVDLEDNVDKENNGN